VLHDGYRFDIGGHRFFSKSSDVTAWWRKRLPDDFIRVRRMSRIFYRGKYYDYPLRPWNALRNLGVFTSIACVLSYGWAKLFPKKPEVSFEDWVSNRFGKRLFRIFFKTYTEKVWGIPTNKLSADWAAQRIKGLSLLKAIQNAFRGPAKAGEAVIKTLVDTFDYPRLGPGQMWERAAADVRSLGGRIEMGARVVRISHQAGRVTSVEAERGDGTKQTFAADEFIVSMPLQETVLAFDPPLEDRVQRAARDLQYRDFLTVALVMRQPNPFPDNWIYIHEPKLKLGRIQNFGNWSSAMIADPGTTCLGLEYFCFAGDGLWTSTDQQLVDLGMRELEALGMAQRTELV
jgi:protoporphyrinogen oxidase